MMQAIRSLPVSFLMILMTACGSGPQQQTKEYTGTVKPAGITSYQYGTHRLETATENFALKSDSVDLTRYEQKQVTLTATSIEGYPIDGGPAYLNVISIKE